MAEKKYVTEHNCETGETIEREYTAAEYAQAELDAQAYQIEQAARLAEETAKAEAKASAESKLAALGLSAEEIAAITK
jgi:hypothetical protein